MTSSPRVRALLANVFVASIVLAGLAVILLVVALTRSIHLPVIAWLFAVCLVLTELRPVSWIKRGNTEVTASWTFAFTLLLVAPLSVALVTLWVASFASDMVRSKVLHRALFNASQLVLSLAAGAVTLMLLTGTHIQPQHPEFGFTAAIIAAATVTFITNGLLTGLVLSLHTDRPIRLTLPTVVLLNLYTDGLLLGVAPIFVVVSRDAPALLPLLALTTWAVYRSACVAEARQFEATHDVLTSLPNRAAFHREAAAALRVAEVRGEHVAVVIIDLDSFKLVNDELGHDIGDRLLQEVGHRLEDNRRPADVVARLAGDEFAVLVRGVHDEGEATLVAERLHAALGEPCELEGFPVSVGASFGVAVFPRHGENLEALLRHADVAMYAAKSAGDGGVRTFDSVKDQRRTGRISLLSELSLAIERNQLVLEYQPKIDLTTNAYVGAEALVRWEHPTLGRIRPDQFVPLAEQTDLMHPFTELVLHSALEACADWHRVGLDLTVGVNVSAHNLRDRHFARKVGAAIAAAGVEPSSLEIELTENTVMADPPRAIAMLSRLRDLGVLLSIDDFGTGYSSLASLRTLPIDRVKIDRSFVSNMLNEQKDLAIVQSIVELSRRMDLRTVAEGVETATIHQALVRMKCNEAQGYYFMRPVGAEALAAALLRRPAMAGAVR